MSLLYCASTQPDCGVSRVIIEQEDKGGNPVIKKASELNEVDV